MWSSRRFAIGVVVAALACTTAAHADPSAPAAVPTGQAPAHAPVLTPETAQLEKEASTGRPLVWIGASIFTVSYIAAALAATTSYRSPADDTTPHGSLWIPFVGPFIDMGTTSGAGNITLLALDGAAQIAGFTLFVYGQTTPKPKMPDSDEARKVTIRVAPVVAPGVGGASVFARF